MHGLRENYEQCKLPLHFYLIGSFGLDNVLISRCAFICVHVGVHAYGLNKCVYVFRYWCGLGPQDEMDGCSIDGPENASSILKGAIIGRTFFIISFEGR